VRAYRNFNQKRQRQKAKDKQISQWMRTHSCMRIGTGGAADAVSAWHLGQPGPESMAQQEQKTKKGKLVMKKQSAQMTKEN
jgi:exopolyphosphatase/pppGpp-phosphohydrolase